MVEPNSLNCTRDQRLFLRTGEGREKSFLHPVRRLDHSFQTLAINVSMPHTWIQIEEIAKTWILPPTEHEKLCQVKDEVQLPVKIVKTNNEISHISSSTGLDSGVMQDIDWPDDRKKCPLHAENYHELEIHTCCMLSEYFPIQSTVPVINDIMPSARVSNRVQRKIIKKISTIKTRRGLRAISANETVWNFISIMRICQVPRFLFQTSSYVFYTEVEKVWYSRRKRGI